MDDYTRSQQQEHQRDYDRDLADWLHMTGWHNELDRNEKLEKWRDIHFDYETQRAYIMSNTWDRLDQDHRDAQMEYEMAGNQAFPQQGAAHHHQALAFRPAPGNHRAEQQNAPVAPRAPRGGGSPAAGPGVQIRGRARERSYRSRSPPPVRGHVRGRHGGGFGGNNNPQHQQPQAVMSVQRPITDIDLGDEGETRFFMIKSVDTRNIFTCWEDNLWATSSVEKGNILADAFDTSKNVVLFFSANGSHAIQGPHDRPPSGNLAKPEWYHLVSRDMSEPFPVEWLSKNVCPDRVVRHLVNRLNFDEEAGSFMPPNRSRDCQEIDGDCGRAMLDILKNFAAGNGAGGAGVRAGN
ncbi:YT521-B-like family protein [Apiospora sp. TS-2023a]